jgi:hypothetical protein
MSNESRLKAIESGRLRRVEAIDKRLVRIQWFIDEVSDKVKMTLHTRVKMAVEYLRDRVVRNISRPVTKVVGVRSGRIVVKDRSKSGEFPKADTTTLMKGIFSDVRETLPGIIDGFVGSPNDYALFLELKLNRKFLTRTLAEERDTITRLLAGPIK